MPMRGRSVTAIILRMPNRKPSSSNGRLEQMSTAVTRWTGSTQAFAVALLIVVVWAASGPMFHFSDTWQLVINTGTTIVTFLMVFLIQRSQNKDSLAIHLKLNEIVAAMEGFKSGQLPGTVMGRIAKGFTDAEISGLMKAGAIA